MKRLAGLSVLLLFVCLSTHAQSTRGAAGGSSSNTFNTGGGGFGGGFGGGLGGFASGGSPLFTRQAIRIQNNSAKGTLLVPSTFVDFDKALAAGRAAHDPANKPKSIAQIAEEYRQMKREKAKLWIQQGQDGEIAKQPN